MTELQEVLLGEDGVDTLITYLNQHNTAEKTADHIGVVHKTIYKWINGFNLVGLWKWRVGEYNHAKALEFKSIYNATPKELAEELTKLKVVGAAKKFKIGTGNLRIWMDKLGIEKHKVWRVEK